MPENINDFRGPISGHPFLDSAGVQKWAAGRYSTSSASRVMMRVGWAVASWR
jgi:hypothetical protein